MEGISIKQRWPIPALVYLPLKEEPPEIHRINRGRIDLHKSGLFSVKEWKSGFAKPLHGERGDSQTIAVSKVSKESIAKSKALDKLIPLSAC